MTERAEQEQEVAESSPLPERYRFVRELGAGGGGKVFAALDLGTGLEVAVKVLHARGGTEEQSALIREIMALSGLEGLGFPRVLSVGRGADGRPYLVRELARGRSFDVLLRDAPEEALSVLPAVADALTVVHRAGLLHGDVKPGNVIVREDGEVALVDLGLATAFRDGGGATRGLTPRYAAPEILRGALLSAEAEVYSLGVILREILDRLPSHQTGGLDVVSERALAEAPARRYPSADEFSEALKLLLSDRTKGRPRALPWPIVGLDGTAALLRRAIEHRGPGLRVHVTGPPGSGRSTLLRRVGWELGLGSCRAVFLDADLLAGGDLELGRALVARARGEEGILLVDGELDALPGLRESARDAAQSGARIVTVGTDMRGETDATEFRLPELEAGVVRRLLRGALPALPGALVPEVITLTGARPLALRSFVAKSQGQALANVDDLHEIWQSASAPGAPQGEAAEDVEDAVEHALDRGRYGQAKEFLSLLGAERPRAAWLLARYEIAAGSAERAVLHCDRGLAAPDVSATVCEGLVVSRGRALLGVNRLEEAESALSGVEEFALPSRAEGLAYRALALSLAGRHEPALEAMKQALELTGEAGLRRAAIIHSAAATVSWRRGQAEDAARAYEKAIECASRAGDAGALASAQINLAGLRKEQGDIAQSVELFEAGIDAALRAGRTVSVQQALLNLANLDIYLGRTERARANLERMGELGELTESQHAQRLGLTAEIWTRMGRVREAMAAYRRCEDAWRHLGRRAESAEAALESILVLFAPRPSETVDSATPQPAQKEIDEALGRARADLGERQTPLLLLAEARGLAHAGESERAEARAEEALGLARAAGQREWAWRSLGLLAELLERAGRQTRAERVRAEAVEILEEIGARLPQDLRQVYWNDPPRRLLGKKFAPSNDVAFSAQGGTLASAISSHLTGADAVSRLSQTPLERRLAKILAINSDLAAETRFELLATKIVLHATELLGAERGYLLLGRTAEELTVAASRAPQGVSHKEFSRSVAAQVLAQGAPFFSMDAGADQRLSKFESVHQAALTAVACVPILAPDRQPLGALYVESRAGVQERFGEELPTLLAFADQAAIALESARLVSELSEKSTALEEKSRALEEKNSRLLEAQTALKGVLAERTERLHSVKTELRRTREELKRTTSFAGLVGGSEGMRRVYSLIERVQNTDVPVLITGESGTGKEVVARAIHEGSRRAKGRMLAVNCGAIPESILESELFGHVRGAFTGADRDRKGLFQEAKGGSLLLDEIGETPLKMQTGLLRVLQESKVRAVGSAEEVPIDVRVLFATNRDLGDAVRAGRFREDLLYRIQVVEIHLPPLRERTEDLPLLVDHFLARCATKFGGEKRYMGRDAMSVLLGYAWPGNVRQLENVLTNAWILAEGETIRAADLNLPSSAPPKSRAARPDAPAHTERGPLSERDEGERARILEALNKTGWNRARAAQVLGMPRRTFYRRLQHYGLQ